METKADQPQAPKPSRAQLKSQILDQVQKLTARVPDAWHQWDYEECHKFTTAMKAMSADNTLPKLVRYATFIATAYGRSPEEVIPMEALQ